MLAMSGVALLDSLERYKRFWVSGLAVSHCRLAKVEIIVVWTAMRRKSEREGERGASVGQSVQRA